MCEVVFVPLTARITNVHYLKKETSCLVQSSELAVSFLDFMKEVDDFVLKLQEEMLDLKDTFTS